MKTEPVTARGHAMVCTYTVYRYVYCVYPKLQDLNVTDSVFIAGIKIHFGTVCHPRKAKFLPVTILVYNLHRDFYIKKRVTYKFVQVQVFHPYMSKMNGRTVYTD